MYNTGHSPSFSRTHSTTFISTSLLSSFDLHPCVTFTPSCIHSLFHTMVHSFIHSFILLIKFSVVVDPSFPIVTVECISCHHCHFGSTLHHQPRSDRECPSRASVASHVRVLRRTLRTLTTLPSMYEKPTAYALAHRFYRNSRMGKEC